MLKRPRFQLFCVETFSSLPQCQSNGRDLAHQRPTSHLRLHALGQQSLVEIVERSRPTAGPGGRTLEDLFHLMIVISIQNHGTAGVSWSVAVVRGQTGIAHCRASQGPGHCRSTVAACCGTDAGFGSARSGGRLESGRCRESGAAVSLPYVSGSPPKTPVAGFSARPAIQLRPSEAGRFFIMHRPVVGVIACLQPLSKLSGNCAAPKGVQMRHERSGALYLLSFTTETVLNVTTTNCWFSMMWISMVF
jgi:hypothetical protein